MSVRPLSALRPGDRATVERLDGSGPVRRRLLELGLTPGTVVTLVRLAPLRDPMTIQVRGYQLCVRRSEAETVCVRLADTFAALEDHTEGNAKARNSENAKGNHHGDTETRRGTEFPVGGVAADCEEGELAACMTPNDGLRVAMPPWFARFVPSLLRVPSLGPGPRGCPLRGQDAAPPPSWIRPRGRRP
jgi:Fe2+ transport system protein FeoA